MVYSFMKKFMIVFVFISLLLIPIHGISFADEVSGDKKCFEYNKLDKDGAKTILQKLAPDVKIHFVQPGPVVGLWEIGMESGGKKGIVYLDYPGEKIISGSIIDVGTRQNLTQESYSKLNKVDLSLIPGKDSILMGAKKAEHKVYVFSDPD
jgi:thiol:disulfide interchange protein DsbC